MGSLAENLRPPYYAAVVSPVGGDVDPNGRVAMDELISLAPRLDGFLGLETARLDDGRGAAICYWKSPAAIQGWKNRVLAQLMQEVNLKHRRIEDACAIEVTRVVKRLFGKKTPLAASVLGEMSHQTASYNQGRAA
jgi:heme-degrading monooxygenase HmoA